MSTTRTSACSLCGSQFHQESQCVPPPVLSRTAQLSIQSQLKTLAAAWREKSHKLRDKYGKENPNIIAHLGATYEACAQDIEEVASAANTHPTKGQIE